MADAASIGSIIGGVGGAAIGGPVGAQIGGAVGGIAGGMIDSANAGDAPELPLVDPNQAARLAEIQATKKKIESGRDALTEERVNQIGKTGETTKAQIGKFTGGDVGSTLSGMLRVQKNVQQGKNQAFTQSQQRLPFFENLQSQLGNRIATRKRDIQQFNQDKFFAEEANRQKQMNANVSGLIGSAAGASFGGVQPNVGAAPSVGATNMGNGVNSLGQFSSSSLPVGTTSIQTPMMNDAFQQGLSGAQGSAFGG